MMNVFRNIRQTIGAERSVRKYMFYAIGEMALVVIGILIALQVNNWNEARQNRRFEQNILTEIHRNLEIDAKKLKFIVEERKKSVEAIDHILNAVNKKLLTKDFGIWLADIINHDRFFSVTNAYEVLKSKGLEIVRHSHLRLELGRYYDNYAKEILLHNKDIENSFIRWTNLLEGKIEDLTWKESIVLTDPEQVLSDRSFLSFLKLQRGNHLGTMNKNQEMLDLNQQLRTMIQSELQN